MKEILQAFKKVIDGFQKIFANLFNELDKINKKRIENKKWKLFLYLNNQCIKKIKIDKNFAPMNKIYVVNVIGKRHLIGTNRATKMVFKSFKYKYTKEDKREAHIEVIPFEGVEINE